MAIVTMIRMMKIVPDMRASTNLPMLERASSSYTGKLSKFPIVAVGFDSKSEL